MKNFLLLLSIVSSSQLFGAEEFDVNINNDTIKSVNHYSKVYDFHKKGRVVQSRTISLTALNKDIFLAGALSICQHPNSSTQYMLDPQRAKAIGALYLQQQSKLITKAAFWQTLTNLYDTPPKEFADEVKDCEIN